MLALGRMGRGRGLRMASHPMQVQLQLQQRETVRSAPPLRCPLSTTSTHTGASVPSSRRGSDTEGHSGTTTGNNGGGTFVSKHFAITASDLSTIVGDTGYFKDYRLKPGGELFVKTCFGDCSRQRKGQADNAWKLLIRRDGSFYCHRCSDSGNWYQLRRRLFGGAAGASRGSGPAAHLSVFGGVSPGGSSGSSGGLSGGGGDHSAAQAQSTSRLQAQLKLAAASGSGGSGGNGGPPVLPDQKEAFGYHLNLTAAIYDPQTAQTVGNAAEAHEAIVDAETGTATATGTGTDTDTPKAAREGPSAEARQRVLTYLRQERGLSDEVIQRYGVGVAMQSFPFYPHEGEEDRDDSTSTNGGGNKLSKKKGGPVWQEKVCVTFPWIERRPTHPAGDTDTTASTSANANANASVSASTPPTTKPTSNSRSAAKVAAALQAGRSSDQPAGKYVIKRIKMRALDQKGLQRVLPKGGSWAFFGWHTVQPHHKVRVLPCLCPLRGSLSLSLSLTHTHTHTHTHTLISSPSTATGTTTTTAITTTTTIGRGDNGG